MGKLPAIVCGGLMLASLGLAGCKSCQSCSSCSKGACPAASGHSAGHYQPAPQGTPTSMPQASQYRTMPGQPIVVETGHAITQPAPMSASSPTGWNNPQRPSPPMPMGQIKPSAGMTSQPAETIRTVPGQPLNPADYRRSLPPTSNAVEPGEEIDDQAIEPAAATSRPAPLPLRNTYPHGIPSMIEKAQQQGVPPATRPRESW